MTFSVQRTDSSGTPSSEGTHVTVQTTYGPVVNRVVEEPGHARMFHGELGRRLAEIEGTTAGRRAYERYAQYCDWKSLVSGDDLPPWEDAGDNIRRAWETAGS
jgi:hypothetical protein